MEPSPADADPREAAPADASHQMRGHLIARGNGNAAPQLSTVVGEGGLQWRAPQKIMQKASGTGQPSRATVRFEAKNNPPEIRQVEWQQGVDVQGSRLQPIRPIDNTAPQELPRLPAVALGHPGGTESLLVPNRGASIRTAANPGKPAGPSGSVTLGLPGDDEEVGSGQPMVEVNTQPGDEDAPPRVPPMVDPLPRPRVAPVAPADGEDEPMPMKPGLTPPAPLDGAAAPKAKVPCLTQYYDRFFCKEGEECTKALKSLNVPLNKLSLDLTPPLDDYGVALGLREFDPNPFDRGAKRVWFDRNGRQVYVSREGMEDDPLAGKEPLYGRMVSETKDAIVIEHVYKTTGTKKRFTIKLADLNVGEIYFLKGRPWHDHEKKLLTTGRLVGFKNEAIQVETSQGIVQVPFRELGSDELAYLNASWKLPNECQLGGETFVRMELADYRHWHCTTFQWKASALCHKPLYFEDVNLERYGHTRGPFLQPLASGAHFFANVCLLPYNMGMDPPGECQYALGYYRPGSCAPWQILAFPISPRGAVAEAGVVTGLGLMIP